MYGNSVEDMVRAVTSGGVMLDITSSIKAEVKPKIKIPFCAPILALCLRVNSFSASSVSIHTWRVTHLHIIISQQIATKRLVQTGRNRF